MTPETSLAALPVRQRGTLEIIDTALKLYRRYFGVLMAWSAIVALSYMVGSIVPFGSFLAYPVEVGSCACCIAAAVRGQRITFGQVWDFTKPRYGAILLLSLLTGLILGAAIVAIMLLGLAIMFGGIWLLSTLNAPTEVSVVLGGLGAIIGVVAGSVLSVMSYAWVGLVPIIACLEDDKRGAAAMGRAWELMKGSWLRVLGLSALLTIAVCAVFGSIIGSWLLFGSGFQAIIDDPTSVTALSFGFVGVFAVFLLFWNPIQTLILAVLYLDLRVRKEALDLEWSSYASAPVAPDGNAPAALDGNAPAATPAAMPSGTLTNSAPALAPLDGHSAAAPVRPPAPATASGVAERPPAPPGPRPPAPSSASALPDPATIFGGPAPAQPAVPAVSISKTSAPSAPTPSAPTPSAPTPFASPPSQTTFAPQVAPAAPDNFDASSSFSAGATSANSHDEARAASDETGAARPENPDAR